MGKKVSGATPVQPGGDMGGPGGCMRPWGVRPALSLPGCPAA